MRTSLLEWMAGGSEPSRGSHRFLEKLGPGAFSHHAVGVDELGIRDAFVDQEFGHALDALASLRNEGENTVAAS